MENPFEIILEKLSNIETLLKVISQTDKNNIAIVPAYAEVLNLKEAAKYLNLSTSHLYKLTATRDIPHYKTAKKIYFKRLELDEWLTRNRVLTNAEIEEQANNYIARTALKRRKL